MDIHDPPSQVPFPPPPNRDNKLPYMYNMNSKCKPGSAFQVAQRILFAAIFTQCLLVAANMNTAQQQPGNSN